MLKSIVVLALVLAPGAALAQLRPDPRTDARMHVGPVYMTPSVTVRNLGIDTNVFNEAENPKTDFTYTLTPKMQLWLPVTRRFLLTTRAETGLVYFQKYADQRSIDPRVMMRGDIMLRRLAVFAEDDFRWSKERVNLEIDDRVRQKVNAARAGLIFGVTPKFSTEVSLYQSTYDFDASLTTFRAINYRAGLKRNERGLRVELSHRLTSKTTLILEAETLRARFDFATVKNSDGFRITPGVVFSPRALISGTAKAGFRRLKPLSEEAPTFQGLVASINMGYTVLGATRLSVEAARDLTYSFEVSQPYYVQNTFGGSIRRQIHGDIDLVLSGKRARQTYRPLAEVLTAPRRDRVLNYAADLGYRLTPAARAGFVLGWQRRESSIASRTYSGVTAGLSLTFGG